MHLHGKRVLVTGGSSGIGQAMAQALLAKGAKVVVTGRRPGRPAAAIKDLESGGGFARGVAADVGSAEGRAATLTQALDTLGGLDILVNNAGGVRAGRLENTTEAEIEAMVTVDLLAPILLTRAALPALRASGDAMVVNVTSGIALIGAPFYTTYAAVGWSRPFRRGAATGVEGRGHPRADRLSRRHRHPDDEIKSRWAGTRLFPGTGLGRRRRHRRGH
jgi:uncharacterized oxidoreductase